MERCQIGGLVELIFRLKLENFELKHVRRSEDCHSFWDKPWWQLKLCTTCPIIHGCLFLFNNACFCIASRYSIAISWKGSWILCYHDIVTTKRKKHGSLGCGPPGCTRDQDNITCLGSSHRCGGGPQPNKSALHNFYMIFAYFYHQAGLLHFLHFCGLFGGFFSPVCICGNGRKAQGFHKSLASLDQSICKLQDDQFALFLPHKSNLACYASRQWIWCIDVHWMIAFCQAHIAYIHQIHAMSCSS